MGWLRVRNYVEVSRNRVSIFALRTRSRENAARTRLIDRVEIGTTRVTAGKIQTFRDKSLITPSKALTDRVNCTNAGNCSGYWQFSFKLQILIITGIENHFFYCLLFRFQSNVANVLMIVLFVLQL